MMKITRDIYYLIASHILDNVHKNEYTGTFSTDDNTFNFRIIYDYDDDNDELLYARFMLYVNGLSCCIVNNFNKDLLAEVINDIKANLQ